MLTIHAMSDKVENQDVDCEPGDEFACLISWAKDCGLSLRHDADSDAEITGWYIEEPDGTVIAGATYRN